MRRWLSILVTLMLGLFLASCDVHELPEGDTHVDVSLNISFDEVLPLFRELDYTKVVNDAPVRQMRHIIRVFRANGINRFSDTPEVEKILYTDGIKEISTSMQLAPVDYKVLVWSDWVDESKAPLYYDADDFSKVRLFDGPYKGSDQYRDAFSASKVLELHSILEAEAKVEEDIVMNRPVAKYSIVSADRTDFLKMFMARLEERYKQSSEPIKYSKPEDIDINLFKIVVAYNGFLPDTYSLWTSRPVDARTGVQFESRISQIESGNLELAFDYIIVNGEESSVSATIYIFDDLNVILSTFKVDIPLHVGMRTTLTGRFLTSGAASGVSINPGYEGEFNVPL